MNSDAMLIFIFAHVELQEITDEIESYSISIRNSILRLGFILIARLFLSVTL